MTGIFDEAGESTRARRQLALASGMFDQTGQFGIGLKGLDDLYRMVTPVTAALLRWWFDDEACAARAVNFHADERQLILDTIVAHEVLGTAKLFDLYRQVAPEVLLRDSFMRDQVQTGQRSMKYYLKAASNASKLRVLQALLAWQALNSLAALDDGAEDPRFTHRFLVVSFGTAAYGCLLDAFFGRQADGIRDPATADIEQCAALLIPHAYRERMFGFVRSNACDKAGIASKSAAGKHAGMIAIVDRYESWDEAVDLLDSLPGLMVFRAMPLYGPASWLDSGLGNVGWLKELSRIASAKGHRFMQVDFLAVSSDHVDAEKGARRLVSISM